MSYNDYVVLDMLICSPIMGRSSYPRFCSGETRVLRRRNRRSYMSKRRLTTRRKLSIGASPSARRPRLLTRRLQRTANYTWRSGEGRVLLTARRYLGSVVTPLNGEGKIVENTEGMKLRAAPVHFHVLSQSVEDGQESPLVGVPRKC